MKTHGRAPRVRGARALVAMLPNGGSVWLNLRPAPVPVRELDRLTDSIGYMDARYVRKLDSNAAGSSQQLRAVKRDTARLSRIRLQQDHKLRKRISVGDAKQHRRIDRSLMPVIQQTKVNRKKQKALLRKQRWRELWNQLVLLSALLLMAAYGQRNNPLAGHNLLIALSLGVWLFGDELADWLSAERATRKDSIQGLDVWSYTAPFANLLTGWWLLSGRQHQRWISGMVDLKDITVQDFIHHDSGRRRLHVVVAKLDLSSRIAPEHFPDFQTFEHVPAIASIRSVEFENDTPSFPRVSLLSVAVVEGQLWIIAGVSALRPALKTLQVAWIVDTQKPADRHG